MSHKTNDIVNENLKEICEDLKEQDLKLDCPSAEEMERDEADQNDQRIDNWKEERICEACGKVSEGKMYYFGGRICEDCYKEAGEYLN